MILILLLVLSASSIKDEWLSESLSAEEMIKFYKDYSVQGANTRDFNTGNILAFVTPWNNKGYDVAKRLSGNYYSLKQGKFTHISPVWLRLEPSSSHFEIEGTLDVDRDWINDLTSNGLKVVPRLIFSNMGESHYVSIIQNVTLTLQIVDLVLPVLTNFGFDGVVLELGVPVRYMVNFIKSMSEKMKDLSKDNSLFVVVPPYHSYHYEQLFSASDLEMIIDYVDGLSLMTYDYSIDPKGGPNAPIEWMADNVARLDPQGIHRSKILMGLNLYGYDYSYTQGRKDIIGDTFISIITQNSVDTKWSKSDRENYFSYTQDGMKHTMYYPTLLSLKERIQLARELEVGLSLWEIGQGQVNSDKSNIKDIFYDLF